MRPRIVKVPASPIGVCVKYAACGRDLIIPAGKHAWRIEYPASVDPIATGWHDYHMTRREAREALRKWKRGTK